MNRAEISQRYAPKVNAEQKLRAQQVHDAFTSVINERIADFRRRMKNGAAEQVAVYNALCEEDVVAAVDDEYLADVRAAADEWMKGLLK